MRLLIHFAPGARGDFLAGILLDKFVERKYNAILSTNYIKIHHINLHNNKYNWNYIERFNGIKIRIDPGTNPIDLITIEINHLIKNNTGFIEKDFLWYEKIYMAICNFFLLEKNDIENHKHLYDYFVSFNDLKNIEFLKYLYTTITKKSINEDSIIKIKNNLNEQIDITQDKELLNLAKLIQFELNANLLNARKNFNIFQNLNNIENFLKLENYQ